MRLHEALAESGFAEVMGEARRQLGRPFAAWLPIPERTGTTGGGLLQALHGGSLAAWAAAAGQASPDLPDTAAARRQLTAWHDLFAVGDHPARTDHEEVYLGGDGLELVDRLRGRPPVDKALDIGSGSGLTTAALARFARRVDAFDISPAAVEATRLTVAVNRPAAEQAPAVEVGVADVCAGPALDGPYDFVCANPPSVPVPDTLPYRAAGNGGPDGLAVIRHVVAVTAASLADRGSAVMRIEASGDDDGPFGVEALASPLLEGRSARVRFVVAGRLRMAVRNAVSARWSSQLSDDSPVDLMAGFDRHTAARGSGWFYTCWLLLEPETRPSLSIVNASPGVLPGPDGETGRGVGGVVDLVTRVAGMPASIADLDYAPHLAIVVEAWSDVCRLLGRGASSEEVVHQLFADAVAQDPVHSRTLLHFIDIAGDVVSLANGC